MSSDCSNTAESSTGTKRKHPASPISPKHIARDPTEAGLQYIRSTLKSALYEAKTARVGNVGEHLVELLSSIDEAVSNLLTKKGKLKSPQQKKAKEDSSEDLNEHTKQHKPAMVDASTDTLLTPRWWTVDPDDQTEESNLADTNQLKSQAPRKRKTVADLGPETMGSEGLWTTAGRKRKNAAPKPAPKPPDKPPSRRPAKAPAVLVKLATGSTYADTVKDIRTSSGLTSETIGSKVKAMRMTRDGHLLVELVKGQASQLAAEKIRSSICTNLGDRVSDVVRLGANTTIEIVDIDAAADKEEVLAALRGAIPGDDHNAMAERDGITVTGLWATKSGQQIATATMDPATATKIKRVPIGWTMCRVRPRRPLPARCFKCHGFGHTSADCSGPDLSTACRRCGQGGHHEQHCEMGNDRCVACEREGFEARTHRPGSGACAAMKKAMAEVSKNKTK